MWGVFEHGVDLEVLCVFVFEESTSFARMPLLFFVQQWYDASEVGVGVCALVSPIEILG
jgi:hypothetical protein